MTDEAAHKALERLEAILANERAMLLTGRAKQAAGLIEDKIAALREAETLLEARDPVRAPAPLRRQVEALFTMARENAVHFEAVRNGLRGAISRLETMHDAAYVGSYSQGGGKLAFPQATGRYRTKV